jgi:hypothetical protein
LLETHSAGGRQDISWGWHRTHVSVFTKGQLSFRVHSPSGDQDFLAQAGNVCVFPSGFDETLFSISGADFEGHRSREGEEARGLHQGGGSGIGPRISAKNAGVTLVGLDGSLFFVAAVVPALQCTL